MPEPAQQVHTLPPAEAARWLGVDEGAIRSLVQARYLSVVDGEIPLAEIRAFQARNAESGTGTSLGLAAQSTDLEALIDALDRRIDELSGRAHEMFVHFIPEARRWTPAQRESFLAQAKGRFGAILAVIEHGSEVDEALQTDLKEVGAGASWAGSSLPHLLLVLRISRDLLLQTTLQIADEGHGRWNMIVSKFLARLMPAIDRLTDAIATGFWEAQIERRQEELDRLNALMEQAPFGFYEADMDGVVQYANAPMAAIVGKRKNALAGASLADIFRPTSGSITQLLAEHIADPVELVIDRGGVDVHLEVETFVRRNGEEAVGFAGIARVLDSVDAESVDLTPLVRHIFELRRSMEILRDAGSYLSAHSDEMNGDQLRQAGESMQRQAERLMVIVDELDSERKGIQPGS